jgi:hypothetical protein
VVEELTVEGITNCQLPIANYSFDNCSRKRCERALVILTNFCLKKMRSQYSKRIFVRGVRHPLGRQYHLCKLKRLHNLELWTTLKLRSAGCLLELKLW